jgi:hypothetical protein
MIMPGVSSGAVTVTGAATVSSSTPFTVTTPTLNPVPQGGKIVGSGSVGESQQGWCVALSADGNTMAVGALWDSSNTLQWSTNYSRGSAWVFVRSGTSWMEQFRIVGTGSTGRMGHSVALSADGNTLAVGDPGDGIGGVLVYTRTGTTWSQQGSKLIGNGYIGSPNLGTSVSLSADGNTLAIGAANDNTRIGATWIFTRTGNVWTQQGNKLVGTGGILYTTQGDAVSLSADGNTLAVGGEGDSLYRGACWIFTRNGSAWTQVGGKLKGTGATNSAYHGFRLALSADGNTLAVAGNGDSSSRGATWIYVRSGNAWTQLGSKIPGEGSTYGQSVSLSADGNILAIGETTFSPYRGRVRLFSRTGTSWTQLGNDLMVTGTNPNAGMLFGKSVALSTDGKTLAAGGIWDSQFKGSTWVFSGETAPIIPTSVAAVNQEATASFWPNPATNQITISGGREAGSMRIIDADGKNVFTSRYMRGESVELPAIATGLYWIQIDGQSATPMMKW